MRIVFSYFVFILIFGGLKAQYRLDEDFNAAFDCMHYTLKKGDAVIRGDAPFQKGMECAVGKPGISELQSCAVYLNDNSIWMLDLKTQTSRKLDTLRGRPVGISDFMFSEKQTSVAFTVLEKDTSDMVQVTLVVYRLRAGEKVAEKKIPIRVNYMCYDARCHAVANEDFWFEDEETIGYRTYATQPYDMLPPDNEKSIRLF